MYHVVTNPIDSDEMNMVPILLATFNNKKPLKLETDDNFYNPSVTWEWLDDSGWNFYGIAEPTEKEVQVPEGRLLSIGPFFFFLI